MQVCASALMLKAASGSAAPPPIDSAPVSQPRRAAITFSAATSFAASAGVE
jgi:hypothetical protein